MHKVVAHFLDGSLVKGQVLFVSLTKPTLSVTTEEGGALNVTLADLKALFFVKDFAGDKDYGERQEVDPADPRVRGAKTLTLRFLDGETLVALSSGYSADRPFFFVVPADPDSNNIRILVNRAAVLSVE